MHPILEEMARAREVQPHAVARWTSILAAHIASLETEIERLKDEAKAKKGRAA